MDNVLKINTEYGEIAPGGPGPNPAAIADIGNPYLEEHFPQPRLHQEGESHSLARSQVMLVNAFEGISAILAKPSRSALPGYYIGVTVFLC